MQYDASAKTPPLAHGRLIYLMGPSGSGKDSLIDAARPDLEACGVRVVRRVITRSAEAVGEAAHSVSPAQFQVLLANSAFVLHWQANGLHYGIPAQIDDWLGQGHSVVVNGSRANLPQAKNRYPDLLPILLTVDTQILRQRLHARGREGAEEIERRLERNLQVGVLEDGAIHLLDNSTQLQDAVARLLDVLRTERVIAAI